MLISLNWIRDFVSLPADLDPSELAERLTMTTAEVEGVQALRVDAAGLVAAEILVVEPIPDSQNLFQVTVRAGGEPLVTVSAAAHLAAGKRVVFAPPGARVGGLGRIGRARVAGHESCGMILPGQALGLHQIAQEAVFLPPSVEPGAPIDVAGALNDCVLEIDNKSITHRPDLWGHYGVAREIAAIFDLPLKPLAMVPQAELERDDLPAIPIVIDDPELCPRYSGLLMRGIRFQPSPLWMQARLSHVGIRPLDLVVDLTNYIMAEIGQPMHAFDGDRVDRIEVAVARPGETFTTLDGVERTMPDGALMIQSHRRSVALAGIMGGAETEVTPKTTCVLLESANFHPAAIRRCSVALGHRTEASARFEKSLDPTNTVLGIRRFVYLARAELPELELASRLSDCFPNPPEPVVIEIDHAFMNRFIGRPVGVEQVKRILERLEFQVDTRDGSAAGDGARFRVRVPSFRATRDVTIEADVIEEVARFVGYDRIEPALPRVTVRVLDPPPLHELERRSLAFFCRSEGFFEVHNHVWYEPAWLRRLGWDPGPCAVLRNPPAAGMEPAPLLRSSLIPGLLQAVERNRHHFAAFRLVEAGSVFAVPAGDDEQRHLALACVQRGKDRDEELIRQAKATLQRWADRVVGRQIEWLCPDRQERRPWEHERKTSRIRIGDRCLGILSTVPLECRRRMEEHLVGWSIVIAELHLGGLVDLEPQQRKIPPLPTYPQVDLDFSVVAEATRRYADIAAELAGFDHALLRRLWLVDTYQGRSIPQGKRAFTFRARLGCADRTLTDADIHEFREAFTAFLGRCGLELRTTPAR